MVDSAPPRHFQFRLRTLMIVVAVLAVPCAYVGWQAKVVKDRKAILNAGDDGPVVSSEMDESKDGAIPTIRLWLGDHFCRYIRVKASADIAPCKVAFPEADVVSSAE